MKIWTREMLQILKSNLKNIILFELGYRMFTIPIFMTVLRLCMRFCLHQSGYSYLTFGNAGSFLLKPWTLACLLLVAFIGMFFLVIESACLITAFQGAAYTRRLTPLAMLSGGVEKVCVEIKRNNVRLLLVVLVQYLVMNVVLIGRLLTYVRPVSFLIQEIRTRPIVWLVLGVILFFCIVMMFLTLFTMQGCMIDQKSFDDSNARSRILLKGNLLRTVGLLLGYYAALLLAFFALYCIGGFLAAIFVVLYTDNNLAMSVLTETCNRIELVLLFLASMTVLIVHYGAVTVFYYQYNYNTSAAVRWDFSMPGQESSRSRLMTGLIAAAALFSVIYIFDLVRNGSALGEQIWQETQITAHRGSSLRAPENTMAAILAAVEDHADYVEIDVQLTADDYVVLGHDATLKRVAGVNRSISSMTLDQLKEIDVGSWFSTDFREEQVPTLEEVMEYSKGRINLNIEIKSVGKDSVLPDKVVELIRSHGMQEQCVVTSTSLNYLRKVKSLMPELRTGYIISAAYGDFYSDEAVDFISIRSGFVSESLVTTLHEQGCGIHVWTVNSKSEMERMLVLGVDNIITDKPAEVRSVIYREERTETMLEYVRMIFN